MNQLFLPPFILAFFIAAAFVIKKNGEKLAQDQTRANSPKFASYASGHDLKPIYTRLRYHSFFRIAWMFGLLHLGSLIVATILPSGFMLWIALGFIVSLGICIWILGGEA
jgi:hypothetical protein